MRVSLNKCICYIDFNAMFYGENEEIHDIVNSFFLEEEGAVLEIANVESSKSAGKKRAANSKSGAKKSKKILSVLTAATALDTSVSLTEGEARSSKETGNSRKLQWKKFKIVLSIIAGGVEDVTKVDDIYFTDEKLALFLAAVGKSMDYGLSAMKQSNAALGDWLHQRGQPKYVDRKDLYPMVIDILKVYF